MPNLDTLRVLLLQYRTDKNVRQHELDLFVRASGLREDQIQLVDALQQPLEPTLLDGVDVIFIGGSGDYLISQGHIPEVVESTGALLREARRRRIPMLGICFGAQLMTAAFGGKLERDQERQEVGTFVTTRTPQAEVCPLFSKLPDSFDAQYGHQDHIVGLPEGAVHLAATEKSALTAFTFPGESAYAMILHPEIDEEAMIYRLDYYRENYGVTAQLYESVRAELRPSPEASQLIKLFLEEIVEKGLVYPAN